MSIAPIRRQILVDADPATAFEVFTAGISRWWPLASYSVHGAGGTVEFTGGQLVEHSPGGQPSVWGTVTRWEPAVAVAFTWHAGRAADRATSVEVTFAAADGQTLVTMTHTGWEAYDDPAAARAEYDQGWPAVLGYYRDQFSPPDGEGRGETWVALLHRPGPAAPQAGSVFDDPRFAEHVAFLHRMRDAGYLMLAGPLADAAGEGMTILRLPGTGQLAEAARLAQHDDTSVASGFFTVTVRPWQVQMQAPPLSS
ncbi:MAG TPA: SRPBCC domain-containing protein [Streptosporangiaceae bacterium]